MRVQASSHARSSLLSDALHGKYPQLAVFVANLSGF